MAASGTIIHMRNVPGRPDLRALDLPLPYIKMDGTMGLIPADFEWNGASGFFLTHMIFPRHNHPIATCRHDWRCEKSRSPEERLFADREFEKDVGKTSWWVTKKVGYIGVRIGAFFGVGVSSQQDKAVA